jgi:hypothetical protein
MQEMNPTLANKCIDVIADYSSIELTLNQFKELMTDNPDLNDQLIEFSSPNDTADREDMLSALGYKLTGREWPMYKDGNDAFEKFMIDFSAGAKRLGYKELNESVS